MRRIALALAPFVLAACERPSQVLLLGANPYRDADGRVVVDVDVEGVEQSGGSVGLYCVSVHWFPPGVFRGQPAAHRYFGEVDHVVLCATDLGDGDRRTVRLPSTRTDLPPGMPARVQIRLDRAYTTQEIDAP
ncbi:MAG: hypothetical protein KF819_22620 [Labilithrix sp.]|nr:hypothetical protein [Labilithrix sp.]